MMAARSAHAPPSYARLVPVFALTNVNGPAWDPSRSRREQPGWDEHAAFMDALVEEGFVVLGGPIGDGDRVLLVFEAADPQEIEARLAPDPWHREGILRIDSIEPWTIWLDGRRSSV
jgi:uncharacterized protein YciI